MAALLGVSFAVSGAKVRQSRPTMSSGNSPRISPATWLARRIRFVPFRDDHPAPWVLGRSASPWTRASLATPPCAPERSAPAFARIRFCAPLRKWWQFSGLFRPLWMANRHLLARVVAARVAVVEVPRGVLVHPRVDVQQIGRAGHLQGLGLLSPYVRAAVQPRLPVLSRATPRRPVCPVTCPLNPRSSCRAFSCSLRASTCDSSSSGDASRMPVPVPPLQPISQLRQSTSTGAFDWCTMSCSLSR